MITGNFRQGRDVSEREPEAAGWGAPRADPLPLDQAMTRRSYVGYGELPPDGRRQLTRPGDELERLVLNISPAQITHCATRRGMPGKVDAPDGTPRIKAVHRHDYGLGPLVRRPADLGPDPLDDAYSKYVAVRQLLPPPSDPRRGMHAHHRLSAHPTMGDDLIAALRG